MKELNPDQLYFVEEFYEDYREGLISRRSFVKRVAFITGSIAATIVAMSTLGCTADELPAIDDPMPTPEVNRAGLTPVAGARSPFSVPAGDPDLQTETVTFSSQGDQISGYLARPAANDEPQAALLVCHENRGLNAHIEDVTRRCAREGYVALAVDLLSRNGGSANLDSDQIPGLLSNAGADSNAADFIAGYHYLAAHSFVDETRVGMVGFCFGGGITWDVATQLPELKAAVPFYGRGPQLARVPDIEAAVLGIYAENDSRINANLEQLEDALLDANIIYEINIYPGVNHAFHNDTGSRYVEEQATEAWLDTLEWFDIYL